MRIRLWSMFTYTNIQVQIMNAHLTSIRTDFFFRNAISQEKFLFHILSVFLHEKSCPFSIVPRISLYPVDFSNTVVESLIRDIYIFTGPHGT